jgi:hypothetical protein
MGSQDLLDIIVPETVIDSQVLRSPLENMLLMSHGISLICSNSTLGCGSVFLSGEGKNVVAPMYFGKINAFSREMILESWKVLDFDSRVSDGKVSARVKERLRLGPYYFSWPQQRG